MNKRDLPTVGSYVRYLGPEMGGIYRDHPTERLWRVLWVPDSERISVLPKELWGSDYLVYRHSHLIVLLEDSRGNRLAAPDTYFTDYDDEFEVCSSQAGAHQAFVLRAGRFDHLRRGRVFAEGVVLAGPEEVGRTIAAGSYYRYLGSEISALGTSRPNERLWRVLWADRPGVVTLEDCRGNHMSTSPGKLAFCGEWRRCPAQAGAALLFEIRRRASDRRRRGFLGLSA